MIYNPKDCHWWPFGSSFSVEMFFGCGKMHESRGNCAQAQAVSAIFVFPFLPRRKTVDGGAHPCEGFLSSFDQESVNGRARLSSFL